MKTINTINPIKNNQHDTINANKQQKTINENKQQQTNKTQSTNS